jgi:hypothetical protein
VKQKVCNVKLQRHLNRYRCPALDQPAADLIKALALGTGSQSSHSPCTEISRKNKIHNFLGQEFVKVLTSDREPNHGHVKVDPFGQQTAKVYEILTVAQSIEYYYKKQKIKIVFSNLCTL